MLVLLDNDVPYGLRRLMRPHVCFHAKQLDWMTLRNGLLTSAAEGRNFQVLITADQSMVNQQNNAKRRIGIVQLFTTRWKSIRLAYESILAAVENTTPGSFQSVDIPVPNNRGRP
jgi:hypothetical protein